MEVWDLCPTPNYHSLDFDWPCHCLDYINPFYDICMSPESVVINHHPCNNICNELCIDKELIWTDKLLADGNIVDQMPVKTENVTVNSPIEGSSHSSLEDQHSEICVEDHQIKCLNDSETTKISVEEEIMDSKNKSKKRKRSIEKGPKYAFRTRSKEDFLEDGYKWRKYGKKSIKSNPNPRSYYRCSASNCGVKKTVERDPNDPTMLLASYEGNHNHESPSVIYYIGKPIVLQQPGSKSAIVIYNGEL